MNSSLRYGIIILVLCFLVYGNSISNGYSLDDHLVNDKNPLTQQGLSGFKKIFTSYSFKEKEYNYEYRPVLLLSFAMEYTLGKPNPHLSHIISILLFALFSFLLFRFLRTVFPGIKEMLIFTGIILFIVHPVHTEVVDNIKCRDELLCGIFGISMLINFQKFLSSRKTINFIFAFLFLVLGYLSKESIFIYGGLIPVLYLFHLMEKGKNISRIIFPVVGVVLCFVLMKLGQGMMVDKSGFSRVKLYYENPLYFGHFSDRVAAGFGISLFYLKLLLWPFELSYYYGFDQVPTAGWGDVITYAGMVVFAFVVYGCIKLIRKEKFLVFCMLILLVNLFVSSNIPKIIPGIAGERFIFMGSAGFCMIVAFLLFRFFENRKWVTVKKEKIKTSAPAYIITGVIILVYSSASIARNPDWKNEFTLTIGDAEHLDQSAKAQDMAAYQLLVKIRQHPNAPERSQWLQEAERYSLRCIEIYPKYIEALNNLGTIYFVERKFDLSEKYYKLALEQDSTDANVFFNLATIYQAENQVDKANYYYQSAIRQNPDLPNLVPYYKQFVQKNRLLDNSVVFIRGILPKFPQNYTLHILLVDLYDDEHDYDSALFYAGKAYQIKSSDELAKFIETLKGIKNKK
jgi:tetratricopeptide (TPR) repeat protein